MDQFDVSVDRIGSDTVLPLWQQAPHASVFTHPEVLDALAHEVHWWLATTAGEPACLWPICLDPDGEVKPPEFAYYLGPFEVRPSDASPRLRLMRAVEVQRSLLEVLSGEYGSLRWSTFPGCIELRPWLWFEADGRRLQAQPRYTAVIDGLDTRSDEDLVSGFSRARRSAIYRGERAGVVQYPEVSLDRVKALYCETMAKNGAGDLGQRRLGEVESLFRIVERGHGFTVACGLENDDAVHAVRIVLVAKGRAYEVLGCADTDRRQDCFNAHARLRSFATARDRGARCYDFNGANTFSRGGDKHSYGAEAALYFDLRFGPP